MSMSKSYCQTQSNGSRWQPALNTCGTCNRLVHCHAKHHTKQLTLRPFSKRTQTPCGHERVRERERVTESREKRFYRLHIWNERTRLIRLLWRSCAANSIVSNWKLILQMHRWIIDRFRCIAISWNATGSPEDWWICGATVENGSRTMKQPFGAGKMWHLMVVAARTWRS